MGVPLPPDRHLPGNHPELPKEFSWGVLNRSEASRGGVTYILPGKNQKITLLKTPAGIARRCKQRLAYAHHEPAGHVIPRDLISLRKYFS